MKNLIKNWLGITDLEINNQIHVLEIKELKDIVKELRAEISFEEGTVANESGVKATLLALMKHPIVTGKQYLLTL